MKKIDQLQTMYETTGIHPGYDLLRYMALPDLLGKDQDTVLYILGKNMSRALEVTTIEELIAAFNVIGLGDLAHVKEKRSEDLFTLTSSFIDARKQAEINQTYHFEAGLISGAMETVRGFQCEAEETVKAKKSLVEFTVKHYR
ncbi:Protein of unknown function [Halolactibacillus halophilus]|uniref:Uncharacterized protein n=1 Tax=Halolactibacillus halophilus TaxID=306540 RepID=A0A1I5L2F4_9BACI|nr:DUF2507 domain-containing protein [Halolactibacillus halophilus]GEM00621.1 hypothetical protein HHA03_01530 [Halolactibacillus halophilus]SFO91504.1 Protein of unknown function [Halolactibacillus halophilus]